MMRRIIIYILFLLLVSPSCKKILFNDEVRDRQILLGDFSAVKFYGIYEIVLSQDSLNNLEISGSKDIYSIDAVIINDTLIIDDHKTISLNTSKNKLKLHFSNLKYMVTYDPVTVTNLDTLKSERFSFDAIGEISEVTLAVNCNTFLIASSANTLGYFHLSGEANSSVLFNRYGCQMFADDLFCRYSEIINESVGYVSVSVSDKITAHIWGPGNIYYHGDPIIDIAEKKGSGKVIRVD